jgi:hypothetical protein
MVNGIYHNCYTPFQLVGPGASKEGYHLKELVMTTHSRFGIATTDNYHTNYTAMKGRNGLAYSFHVPALAGKAGTAIQIVPFQDDATNWPNIGYEITGSLDGVHWETLPTPVSGTVTNSASPVHGLFLPYSVYKVTVTGGSNNGYFAVISN